MRRIRLRQNLRTGGNHLGRFALVNHFGGEHRDTGVTMLRVVPDEEFTKDTAGDFGALKALWDFRAILHRLEVALRERIVIACMRTRMALFDSHFDQKFGDGLAGHGTTPICVDSELSWSDFLAHKRLLDERFGDFSTFALGKAPTHHVPTIDVNNDIEIVVAPLFGGFELGDIPTPDLIASRS